MLMAFKEQLKHIDKTNAVGLAEEIKRRAPDKNAGMYLDPIRHLILVMPDLIQQIQIWTNDDRVPSKEKKLHGFLLTYLYHPVDFIPDSKNRLFSYVDDAYLVGSVFIRSFQNLDFHLNSKALNDLSRDVQGWLDKVRDIIPNETEKIDYLLGELINGRLERFDQVMTQNEENMRDEPRGVR